MFTKFMESADCFISDESGQGLIEYAGVVMLAAALVLLVYTSGVLNTVSAGIRQVFTRAIASLESI